MNVTVYSKPNCPQCEHTRRDLDRLGIAYRLVDLTSDAVQLERLRALGHRSAPVVEAGAQSWSGYRRERIEGLLRA